jgi:hypothetical protein
MSPAHPEGPSTVRTTRARIAAAEQLLEEIAMNISVARRVAASAKLKIRIPVRPRAKLLSSLPLRTELIVGCALLGVFDDFVGFPTSLNLESAVDRFVQRATD